MHFDNPVFIFIVIVAALLRWLSKRSETTGEDPVRPNVPNEPIPRSSETQTEEERIRRFLEALGQPTGSKPPPKVVPKRQRRVQPRVFPSLPPLKTFPPPEPTDPVSTVETPPPLPLEKRVFTPAPVMETNFEVRDVDGQSPKNLPPNVPRTTETRAGITLKFESTQDLRNAIILREILGPPRSMQPLEMLL